MGYLRSGLRDIWRHLGTSLGGHLEVDSEGQSGSILGQFWTIPRPILGNLIIYLEIAFIWP